MTSPEIETAQAILRGDLSGIVRPLEWHHYPETNYGVEEWVGSGACDFRALVQHYSDGWQLVGDRTTGTLEDRKAAAQADYAKRVASTLGPAIIAMAQAFLDLHAARAGWKLVPVEPTAEMRVAAERTARRYNPGRSDDHVRSVALDGIGIYRAMVDAAPKTEDRT